MKKKLLLSFSIAVFCGAHAIAGGITVRAVNRPAEKVFMDIMKQSGKNYVYPAGLLDNMKVSVNVSSVSLSDALDKMFYQTGIGYKIKGNNVTLFRELKKERPLEKRSTVSGFVKEAGSGEALVGAVVKAGGRAAVSNVMGFYSITLPEGETCLEVTYPGFACVSTGIFKLTANKTVDFSMDPDGAVLDELVVHGSRNNSLAMESASVGALNLNKGVIASTPVIFGESDVIKTLQLEPGVSAGVEGMAGMYVHGGNADENLYMLDNIPLYQVNHVGGLFSAFNTEAIRNVDFHKSTFPAKYDGRLSSFMDVHTKDGSLEEHHGSVKLGLTSGAFSIDGPIWKGHTSYSVALRRSWFDVLTLPACAIFNSFSKDEKYSVGLAFTDFNAKVKHRFSERSSIHAMLYFGEDYLYVKQSSSSVDPDGYYDFFKNDLKWGNLVVSAGWNYVVSPKLFGEFTAAYTRYMSKLKHAEEDGEQEGGDKKFFTYSEVNSDNNINDWIFKGDFDWRVHDCHTVNFGASYTRHSFLPFRDRRVIASESISETMADKVTAYHADEVNAYVSGDWQLSGKMRLDYGLHYNFFNIEGNAHQGLSPRMSFRWNVADGWAVKGGYSRTVQYVHQLIQSSISLPTDQWIPIIGSQKPQTADKIAAGVYYSPMTSLTFSLEGYWKWMDNIMEYADEYYLLPPDIAWSEKMAIGKGTAKGLDFKVAKEFGNISGHIAYSLLWADRQYPDKNHGKNFPARFDNRHKINVMVNWKINDKWDMNVSWTGMSGNRITLPTQCWVDPGLGPWHYDMILATDINNFRLPFYHRMDLGFTRRTSRGYWNFSLYNAYCNMNMIGVLRDNNLSDNWEFYPVFKKIRLLPIIPSVSYTWIF